MTNDDVLIALGWTDRGMCGWRSPTGGYFRKPGDLLRHALIPRPMDSVDDGLEMIPKGWRTLHVQQEENGEWLWVLIGSITRAEFRKTLESPRARGTGHSMAAALSAALMKVKER